MTTKLKAASFQDGAVTSAKIAADAITNAKIAADAITNAKIADDAVQTENVASTVNLGRRNIIINGAMQVAQRGTSATGLGEGAVGYVALDRFRIQKSANPPARYTMTQDSNAPTGFANSMKLEVTTVDTSVASGSLQYIDQFIEAQNLQQLAYGTASAEKITLSFYVKCSTAQTFALDLVNEDNSRYFNTTYTVSSADTWERKIITFPADTVSGFNNDNGRGLRVRWTLVAGSNYTDGSVSTAWSGTQHTATNHQNTWVGATGRTWQLTGVQLEVGEQATPFEHASSFGETLALCQRYYNTSGLVLSNTTPYRYHNQINLNVEMRATPTISTVAIDSGSGGNIGPTWDRENSANSRKAFYQGANNSAISNARFKFDAEL